MNPMTRAKTYQALATRRLPHLTLLDGCAVSPQDRHRANTTGASITTDLIFQNCTFQQHAAPGANPCRADACLQPNGRRDAACWPSSDTCPVTAAVGSNQNGVGRKTFTYLLHPCVRQMDYCPMLVLCTDQW